ncbi:conjugal transfer protein TraG N-terminal domain-containing protein [Aeromonas caviae]|jgi:conjugal transfer mating pair stabilization protein TraG|uniref:Conjugal protein n=3 Tax=Aeromonas TaxID=642 RepID=A0A189PGW1_AERSS|nr:MULTISPECIES: conjugal transfer protein TraG N-terminal domain-containing protein [Aeromonas]HDO1358935.1 conjugal transfer protein TraG N-terminal domain-containing protein [Aeromonas veronii]ALL42446.1 conjugal protein [Aeromonas salmonicida subsp. salmonicida]ASI25751.1 conjugal transfer protein TraG [Aeromonas salmonicida]MDE8812334.1 conjugal transfer protein TraG N-terminal domain-containing protein [Aeromonas hydrophila]MDF8327097.1 conjugal transfer protein TraG N-terminal domain-co
MGTFTIYSIGDSAFLEQILIAVSMITGTGDFEKMVSIGLLLGVLMIMIQSVFQGAKQINIQQILVGWLIYACFFGPNTTVTIEDAYTGQVRVVANVPLGVGFTGGVISNVGYTITNLFETGYGVIVPNVTESHFSETLKLLNDVRRRAYDSGVFTALNASNGGGYVDVRRSWNNYIRECTLTKVDLNLMSLDELMNRSTDAALRFNSQLYGTRLYLSTSNPDGADYTCTEGWVAISNATANLNSPLVVEALNNLLGLDPASGDNSFTKISDSLQALGATTTSAFDYIKAAVLEPLYYEAASGRYQDLQDFSSALMINQAVQQRNTQWAAEQTMFMTVVRPMLTFFEGFIYAITPIIAFIIVMGSFGVQLAGKYVQTILWIQLWMPVLSIINLFVHTAATNQMASLSANGLNSMYALSSSGDVLQHWIATGGMLAASTPIISLFIVSGSTYAFTSLASKIGGGDHVDEKLNTPDVLKQGPLMQAQPGFNQNQFSGTLASGAEGMISTLSLGSNMASGVSSSQANQKQASEAFQSNLTRGFSDGTSQAQTYSRLSNVGRTISSQGTEQSSLVDQQAKNFMEKFGVDQSHSDAVKGAVAMQASGSIDAGKFAQMLMPFVGKAAGAAAGKGGDSPVDVKAGVTGSSTSSADDSTTWTSGDVTQFAKGINYSQTDSQALTNQLAQGFSRSGGESFSHTWGDSLSQNLSKSASEVVSASNSFNTMSQLQNQVGSMTNTDFKTLGGAVAQSPAAMGQLNEYFRNAAPTAVKDEAGSLEQRYRSYGMSPEVAQSAARMTAMTNPSNYEPGKELGGFQSALQAINTASGRASGYSGDAYANSGLSTPNVSGLPSQVQGAVGAGPNIGPDFRGNTAATAGMNPESEVGQLPNNSPIVQQEHQSRAGSLDSKAQDTERRLSAPEVQNARDNLLNALPPMSWTASGWGSMDNGSDWMSRAGKSLIAGGEAGGAAFTQVTDQMRTMTPEQRDEFIATTQRGDDALQEQYGWQGEALVGAAKLGRGIMGATATGYDAAKEWMTGNSDLSEAAKGMNLEQRGAFYASALTAATEAGVDTTQQFMQQYGNEYKETMQSIAQSHYGLSQNQAAVFGQSFSTDKGQMDQAVNNLKMEYAERNPDGSPMIENGVPVLSQQNEEFTNQMVNVLQNASNAGDRAGSYLTPIRGYNITERGLDSKH